METGKPTRRRVRQSVRRGDAREQALLAHAESLLGKGRFDEASLADIARAAGISRPTFYFYFESKQALLAGLLERTLDDMRVGIEQAFEAVHDDPREGLRAALRGVANLWWDHHAVLIAAADLAGATPAVFGSMRKVIEFPKANMARLLRQVGGNRLSRDQASAERLAIRLAWMAERNFYVLARTRPSRRQLHALADELADICLAAAGQKDIS